MPEGTDATLEETIRRILAEILTERAQSLPESNYRTKIRIEIETTDPLYPHRIRLGEAAEGDPGTGCCEICCCCYACDKPEEDPS
jgi:hypothetical protein